MLKSEVKTMLNKVARQFPHTRLRRLRASPFIRHLVAEAHLTTQDFIYPIFVLEGENRKEAISSMPGVFRLSLDLLLNEASEIIQLGIPAMALFPVIHPSKKTFLAEEAYNPDGLIPRAVRELKRAYPNLGVITDVALDPYTSHGQDGLINETDYVLNDETVAVLVEQALSHARAGADIVASSDLMDGRVGAIRLALETEKWVNTQILAYSAKYASHFYTPF